MNKVAGIALSTLLGGSLVIGAAPSAHAATSLRDRALSTAAAQKGDPYRWGAAGPDAFDCSGLTYYSFKRNGKTLPRTAQAQYNHSKHISASSRTLGDLVFFYGSGGVYHVAIYAGHGYIWEAPKPGSHVHKVKIWSKSVYYGRY